MLVFNHSEYQVLLGIDYFNKTGLMIRPRDGTLYFPDETTETVEEDENCCFLINILELEDETDNLIEWKATKDIKAEIDLPQNIKERFEKLYPIMRKNMASNYQELKGGCKIGEFNIKLLEDKVVFKQPYKRSEKEKLEMRKATDELLAAGIISLSTSAYSSPFFRVKKKGGTFRPVFDYKELNAITEKIHWPMPKIDDLLFKMKKAKYFSKADCKSGFLMIPNSKKTREYLAFSDGTRKLTWNFMPMGVSNGPMVFSSIMHRILGDFDFVFVYVDDICIYSETIEDHIKHIEIVIKKLQEVNLKLNPDKCVWFTKRLDILGHVISDKGIEPDLAKIAAIRDRKAPTSVKELQCFLGLANYYRNFVRDFAHVSSPLYTL